MNYGVPSWIEPIGLSRIQLTTDMVMALDAIATMLDSHYTGCYYKDSITPFLLHGSELGTGVFINSASDLLKYLNDTGTAISISIPDKYSGELVEQRLYSRNFANFDKSVRDTRSASSILNAMILFAESDILLTTCEEADFVKNDSLGISSNVLLVNETYLQHDSFSEYLSFITSTPLTERANQLVKKTYSKIRKMIIDNYLDKKNMIRLDHSTTSIIMEVLPSPSSIRYLLNTEIKKGK